MELPENYPYIAVIISTLATFVLGWLWYHPKVLGQKWLVARGLEGGDGHERPRPKLLEFVFSFLLWFLASAFFGFLAVLMPLETAVDHIGLACFVWVAFAMPPLVMGSFFTGYPLQAVAIDASYQLAGYYIISMIIVFMGA